MKTSTNSVGVLSTESLCFLTNSGSGIPFSRTVNSVIGELFRSLFCLPFLNITNFRYWPRNCGHSNISVKFHFTVTFSASSSGTVAALVGLSGPYVHKGPYPSFDHAGYEVAIQMVLMSRCKERHSPTHLQFNTVRKLRTVYGNQMQAAPEANRVTLSLGDQKGRYTRFTHDKCASLWFYCFLEGCQRRMGKIWKPNQAFSSELLGDVLAQTEAKIASPREENRWVMLHT
jgi:hypothetical protein